MSIVVTGGAGFIGSNFIERFLETRNELVINLDSLTYASDLNNIINVQKLSCHELVVGNISDEGLIDEIYKRHMPRAVIHFAAESHVDRSIDGPQVFIDTNVVGTFKLLNATRRYFDGLSVEAKKQFRFVHISTDEVFGSLGESEPPFKETNQYLPNSPYSASKAASDHFVRSYFKTYGLPVITTNCSNNYGPRQHSEKLIPRTISNALKLETIPIYGDGLQIRDWIYVRDHCDAILTVLDRGTVGETYAVGGDNEIANIDLVRMICDHLDSVFPNNRVDSYNCLLRNVNDRAGHDRRYAIDNSKINRELGWHPIESFESGLQKTVEWYLQKYKATQSNK